MFAATLDSHGKINAMRRTELQPDMNALPLAGKARETQQGRRSTYIALFAFIVLTLFGLAFAVRAKIYSTNAHTHEELSWATCIIMMLVNFYSWGVLAIPIARHQMLVSFSSISRPRFACLFVCYALPMAVSHHIISAFVLWQTSSSEPPAGLLGWIILMIQYDFAWHLLVAVGITGCLIAYRSSVELHEVSVAEANARAELNFTQMELLVGQLQPHCVLNALNGIASLTQSDPERAESMILKLGGLLKVILGADHKVRIQDEVAFIQSYLELQQMRFGTRLQFQLHVEKGIEEFCLPSFLLLPLVENSIKHGLRAYQLLLLVVSIQSIPGKVQFTIVDKPQHEAPVTQLDVSTGVGLQNTRARLEHFYGTEFAFEYRFNSCGGNRVVIVTGRRK